MGHLILNRSYVVLIEPQGLLGPKWGMGPIQHSGKLYVRTKDGKRRELILLGRQDGEALRAAVGPVPMGAPARSFP